MCMLTFLPEEVMPDEDALANGAAINSDGHGFAIVTGQRLLVERDMTAEKLIERFTVARHAYPEGPALFHSRMATAGDITVANCHPYRVGADTGTVLAHNGILPSYMQPAKRDKRSDTRIAAEDFLPSEPFGPLGTARARTRMERWLTDHNKIVILTVNPRYRRHAYVLNEHAGIWDNGVWYSNDDYRRSPLLDGQRVGAWDDETCLVCGTPPELDNINGVCETCGTCLDCYASAEFCMCYLPASARQRYDSDLRAWPQSVARLLADATLDAAEEPGDHSEPVGV